MHVSRAWAVKRGGCRRHERAAEPMLEWLFVFSVVVCVCVSAQVFSDLVCACTCACAMLEWLSVFCCGVSLCVC